MLDLVRPEWFVPVHGEYRHMVHHAQLAEEVGVPPENVKVCEDGDVVNIGPGGVDVERRAVPAGYQYVDGITGDVDHGVLRDRRTLAEEGFVVVIVTVDAATGEIVTGPEIVTRGWVWESEAEDLIEDAKAAVRDSLARRRGRGRPRLRHAASPRSPCARPLHQPADAPAPCDHPGGDGGLVNGLRA